MDLKELANKGISFNKSGAFQNNYQRNYQSVNNVQSAPEPGYFLSDFEILPLLL